MQSSIQAFHPNTWTFFQNALKKEQALHDVQISHMLAGQPAPPQRRQYRECNKRIRTIVASFEEKKILDYLRGIAHNLSF